MAKGRSRRELLDHWVSGFLEKYKPEESTHNERRVLFSEMTFGEANRGSFTVEHKHRSKIVPAALFQIGEQYAIKWHVPITLMALTALIISCRDGNQVQMMMAVAYHRFLQCKALGQAQDPLDTAFVSALFEEGSPSQKHLDEMWIKQKLQPGELSGDTHRNMLDYVSVDDFQ